MKTVLSLALVFLLTNLASAQIGVPCHENIFRMTPRHSLNITAFMGSWYAQEYAGSDIGNTPEPFYKCLKLDFSLPDPADLRNIDNSETFINIEDNLSYTDTNKIVVNATRSPLSSVWELTSANGEITVSQILMAADLDFSQWAMFYSCRIKDDGYRWETASVYTRERQVSNELRNYLKALMVGLGFRIGDHKPISQQGCDS